MKFEHNLDPASRKQPSSSKLKPPSSISRYNAPTSTTSTSSDYTSSTSTSTSTSRPTTQTQRSLDTEHYYSLPAQESTTSVRPSDIKRHQIATSAAASTSGATLVYLDPSRHHYSQQYQSLPVDNTTSNTTRSSGLNVNKVSSSLSIEDSNNNHSAVAARNHRSTTTINDIVAFNSMMPASATSAAVPSSSSSVIPHRRAISTNAAASSAAVAGSSLPLPASSSNIKRLTAHFSNTSLKHSSVPLSSAAAAATGAASQSIAPLKTALTSSAIPGFSSSSTYRHSIPTSLSSMCFIIVGF